MRYLSVCSGIEAATQAWHPLGWSPVAFSEIEPFPSAVLAHRYPSAPNWGDMTRFAEWPDATVDLLVGGTPCQSFSVAGLRKGLRDPRGNLALVYLALADRYRPNWLVWENVPGVLSSNGGRDFGAFLGGLGELGYGFAYRVLDAQYVRTRRFGRAVPQRRRRVFVVGYLGDWRRAAAVLFDRESLLGNSPPRREAGEGTAGRVARSLALRGREGGGTAEVGGDFADTLRASTGGGDKPHALIASTGDVSHCLNAGGMGRIDYETETMIAHALRGEGFDAGEDGTGRGTPLGPVAFAPQAGGKQTTLGYTDDGTCQTLGACQTPAIAFDAYNQAVSDVSHPLRVGSGNGYGDEIPQTLQGWAVRRLTPLECERLQGFPDGFTAIPMAKRNRAAETAEMREYFRRTGQHEAILLGQHMAPDGPRYKSLGNSIAVNCLEWIGERIALVDSIERAAA